MGCDGGSICDDRDVIVKLKKDPKKIDKNTRLMLQWTICKLSEEELKEPIVACNLGFLYNKEAVLTALLDKKMPQQFSHIRRIRDVFDLHLTLNPDRVQRNSKSISMTNGDVLDVMTSVDSLPAKYICPITKLEIKGQHRFVAIKTCGHVIAEKALKTLKRENPNDVKAKIKERDNMEKENEYECALCGKFFSSDDIILLNPSEEELAKMREKLVKKRESSKTSGKKKKEKENSPSKEENNITVQKTANTQEEEKAVHSQHLQESKKRKDVGDDKNETQKRKEEEKTLPRMEDLLPQKKQRSSPSSHNSETTTTTRSTDGKSILSSPINSIVQSTIAEASKVPIKATPSVWKSIFVEKTKDAKQDEEKQFRNDFLVRPGMRGMAPFG